MQRFKGSTFAIQENNSVLAIAAMEVAVNYDLRERIKFFFERELRNKSLSVEERDVVLANVEIGIRHIVDTPIFTFVREELSSHEPVFTGSLKLADALKAYIQENGGKFDRAPNGLYVPFSSGAQYVSAARERELQLQRSELRFVTTEVQFLETFGVTRAELMQHASDATRHPAGYGSLRY